MRMARVREARCRSLRLSVSINWLTPTFCYKARLNHAILFDKTDRNVSSSDCIEMRNFSNSACISPTPAKAARLGPVLPQLSGGEASRGLHECFAMRKRVTGEEADAPGVATDDRAGFQSTRNVPACALASLASASCKWPKMRCSPPPRRSCRSPPPLASSGARTAPSTGHSWPPLPRPRMCRAARSGAAPVRSSAVCSAASVRHNSASAKSHLN